MGLVSVALAIVQHFRFVNQILWSVFVCDDLRWKVIILNETHFLWYVYIYFRVTLLQVKTLPYDWNHFDTQQSIESLRIQTHNKTNHNFFFFERKILLNWHRPKSSRIRKKKVRLKMAWMCCYRPSNYKPCLWTDWILCCFFGIWFWLRFFHFVKLLENMKDTLYHRWVDFVTFNHNITSWHLSI